MWCPHLSTFAGELIADFPCFLDGGGELRHDIDRVDYTRGGLSKDISHGGCLSRFEGGRFRTVKRVCVYRFSSELFLPFLPLAINASLVLYYM